MEKKVPLSQTILWQHQYQFYQQEGIKAWDSKVPYYATSNPAIANSYAQIIINFLQEIDGLSAVSQEPVYIVELGTGSGTFSFYLLKHLCDYFDLLPQLKKKFIYVMTDMVESNIQFWETNPSFKPYFEQGLLDFAKFDVQMDTEIYLRNTKILLSEVTKHPTIFIANYFFDTLPHDIFRMGQNRIEEVLLDYNPVFENVSFGSTVSLSQLNNRIYCQATNLPYYNEPYLDDILKDYTQYDSEYYVLFPIGALRCINKLQSIAKNQLLLLVSDKGFSQPLEQYGQSLPILAFHDKCFSMMLNFSAIDHYFKKLNGNSFQQIIQQDYLVSSAFILGNSFERFPLTTLALKNYFEIKALGNTLIFYEITVNNRFNYSLEDLLKYLINILYDPKLFNECLDAILQKVEKFCLTEQTVINLITIMNNIASNIYSMPGQTNTLANIGLLFHKLGQLEQAIDYYQAALSIEKKANLFFNMALCYLQLDKPEMAQKSFNETLTLDANDIMAKGWLSHITSRISNSST